MSHFNVSLIVQGKVPRVSIYHNIMKRKVSRSGESNLRPSAYQPSASPPGQGSSQYQSLSIVNLNTNLHGIDGAGSDDGLVEEVIVAMQNRQVLFLEEVLKVHIQLDL